jgi:hypothetical protein
MAIMKNIKKVSENRQSGWFVEMPYMLLFNRNVIEADSGSLSFGKGWGEAPNVKPLAHDR